MKIANWGKVKEGTLLIITWVDILAVAGWLEDTDAQELNPTLCKTVGWFVNADKLNIRLTDSVAEDGDKSVTVIPKGVIRNVQKIKYRREN